MIQMDEYQKEIETGIEAVRQAALLCRAVQETVGEEVLAKKDRSPVTVADFGSQALICRSLALSFPVDSVIGEEDSRALVDENNSDIRKRLVSRVRNILPSDTVPPASDEEILSWIDRGSSREYQDRFWTLDPIDGTKGFLRGGHYAIALALIVKGELQAAVLGCPNLYMANGRSGEKGSCFFAVKGGGSYCVPLFGQGEPRPVGVSEVGESRSIRFCESYEAAHSSHEDADALAKLLGIEADPVRIDSQAKYAMVARGEGEVYLRLPRGEEYREKIWDHAAGALVVTEAGGKVTDIFGRKLDFTHGRNLEMNRGVIATNGILHDRIIDALKKVRG